MKLNNPDTGKATSARRDLSVHSKTYEKSSNVAKQIIRQNCAIRIAPDKPASTQFQCVNTLNCKHCGSDYMPPAENGFCQLCHRKVEFEDLAGQKSSGGAA